MTDIHKLRLVGPDTVELVDTVWDDIKVAPERTRINAATSKPDYGPFPAGAAYSKALLFDGASEEIITFSILLPHSYKLGTDLHPHVHWAATTNDTGKTVRWDFNYSMAEYGDVFPGSDTLMTATYSGDTTANKHDILGLGTLDGSSIASIAAKFMCSLSRRGDLDTYPADVALLEFDFHYEIDTIGSREQFTK